jgi:hypothetical protein
MECSAPSLCSQGLIRSIGIDLGTMGEVSSKHWVNERAEDDLSTSARRLAYFRRVMTVVHTL